MDTIKSYKVTMVAERIGYITLTVREVDALSASSTAQVLVWQRHQSEVLEVLKVVIV